MTMFQLFLNGTPFSYFIQVLPVTAVVGVIYGIIRFRQCKNKGIPFSWKEIVFFLFVCYLTGLVALVLSPQNLWTAMWFYLFYGFPGSHIGPLFVFDFNFTPTILSVLRGELILGEWVKTMLFLNFLMFVPMGIFLRLLLKKTFQKYIVGIALAITLAVELLQPIVGRSFDIDDIILNTLGTLCGWVLCFILTYPIRKKLYRRLPIH